MEQQVVIKEKNKVKQRIQLNSGIKAGVNCCADYSGGPLTDDYIRDASLCCYNANLASGDLEKAKDCFGKIITKWWTC